MGQDFDRERIAQATGDREASNEQILWGFKVMKKIVGADGVSESEMAGLLRTMQQYGASAAMMQIIESFDVTSVDLKDLLKLEPTGKGIKRLLYAAIVVAWADGKYSLKERAAVGDVASFYNIGASTVATIENLVLSEQQMASMRYALLSD